MHDSSDASSHYAEVQYPAEPDYWYDIRLTYRRRGWKPRRVDHCHFLSVQEACEYRDDLLANDCGLAPIDVAVLEVIDVSATWNPPPRKRLLSLLNRWASWARPRGGQ